MLWRCLHGGPLTTATVDQPPEDERHMPWQALRERNLPLLQKLRDTYGAYAIIARDGDRIVGQLRFYPRAIMELPDAGLLCMQQLYPEGPLPQVAQARFPPLAEIANKTLVVHCMMTGSPSQPSNPYQRQGIGTRMAQELMRWGKAQGWTGIEASAYADLPLLYAISGAAGVRFWEKLGYRMLREEIEPWFAQNPDFLQAMIADAAAHGIDPAIIQHKHIMRTDLV